MIYLVVMVIFHSYVSLQEGIGSRNITFFSGWQIMIQTGMWNTITQTHAHRLNFFCLAVSSPHVPGHIQGILGELNMLTVHEHEPLATCNWDANIYVSLDDVSLENAWTCRQCSLQTWDVPKRQLKTSGTSQVAPGKFGTQNDQHLWEVPLKWTMKWTHRWTYLYLPNISKNIYSHLLKSHRLQRIIVFRLGGVSGKVAPTGV